jgi:hypothetical protein
MTTLTERYSRFSDHYLTNGLRLAWNLQLQVPSPIPLSDDLCIYCLHNKSLVDGSSLCEVAFKTLTKRSDILRVDGVAPQIGYQGLDMV